MRGTQLASYGCGSRSGSSDTSRQHAVTPDSTTAMAGGQRVRCRSMSASSKPAGWTSASVRARDVPRAFVDSRDRRRGDCAARESSLRRPSCCARPSVPARCPSSGESPVARTQPALERVRASPRIFRGRARESSSSLPKCSCFKTYCMLRLLQGSFEDRSTTFATMPSAAASGMRRLSRTARPGPSTGRGLVTSQ